MQRSKPRYDARAAAQRARTMEPSTSDASSAQSPAMPLARAEYRMLSVWQIQAARWQARRVFEHIGELAATIEGNTDSEGVGVLEPILVRLLEDGGYQLIDGERRLRACRLLAERSPSRDYHLPARIFDVSERVAQLMGQTANLERDEPKPLEVALGYQSIREALRAEVGDAAASARGLAGLGRHGKSQVADYLRIADALTPDVLAAAGVGGDQGEPDFALLARLTKKELHAAARQESTEERAAALRVRVARLTGAVPRRTGPSAPRVLTPEARRIQIMTETGFALRVRTPVQMLGPAEADGFVRNELAPAMLAMVERAHGGAGKDGLFVDVAPGHALLVLPFEVEALSMVQLERLATSLAELRHRTQRALRLRRSRASVRPPAA